MIRERGVKSILGLLTQIYAVCGEDNHHVVALLVSHGGQREHAVGLSIAPCHKPSRTCFHPNRLDCCIGSKCVLNFLVHPHALGLGVEALLQLHADCVVLQRLIENASIEPPLQGQVGQRDGIGLGVF